MTKLTQSLQDFFTAFAEATGIETDFMVASDHPYHCRCAICREWWLKAGPDPDTDEFGPFGTELQQEWEDRQEKS